MSSETELLLCCLRTCIDAERAGRIRTLLQEDIDWDYLLQVAERHGVIPLLYWNLNATCAEAVPKAILDRLQTRFYFNTCHNVLLTRELLKLLQLFEGHGISAVPYKGPALAEVIYGNLALRYFSDLDILVRQRDVLTAKDLAMSQGYRPRYQLTPWQERAHLHSRNDYVLDREDPRIHLEIHWHIVPRYFSFPLDLEPVWERLETVFLAGTPVACLPLEELLLTLCVHGGKHCWERLGWIVDIAELTRVEPGINWPGVMELARKLGSERFLCLGLLLARDLLETVLPEEVSGRIEADPVIHTLAAQVCQRLFLQTNNPPSIFATTLFCCRARERWRDRVRYCLRFVGTPALGDWEWVSLPASLACLYYPLRPLRLGAKYGLRLIQSVLGF